MKSGIKSGSFRGVETVQEPSFLECMQGLQNSTTGFEDIADIENSFILCLKTKLSIMYHVCLLIYYLVSVVLFIVCLILVFYLFMM